MDTAQPKRIQRKRTKGEIMSKSKKIVVKQTEGEPEIPAEIIAKSIVQVSENARKMAAAGLKEQAIVILLHHYCHVSQREIRLILRALPELQREYTTK